MATTTTNFGWDIPQSTDLVKDGATAIAALGQDIDTALVDLKGGTTGQVLAKASNTDLDFSWVAVDPLTILDAKGDLITATAADTPARLAVGTNGHVLTADSTAATGLKWAAVAAGGKVLQVVDASTATAVTVTSATPTDSGLTASITPTLATSKILVIYSQSLYIERSAVGVAGAVRLLRGSTSIQDLGEILSINVSGATFVQTKNSQVGIYLDSPNTTSSTTYKTQINVNTTANGGSSVAQQQSSRSSITLIEIGA